MVETRISATPMIDSAATAVLRSFHSAAPIACKAGELRVSLSTAISRTSRSSDRSARPKARRNTGRIAIRSISASGDTT